ncbi:hypothetical protein pb186bvf_018655 [Paramecium bursaria]
MKDYQDLQEKYSAQLGSNSNPIQSHDQLEIISRIQTDNFYYFKFGQQNFSTFCKVLNGEVWIKLLTIQQYKIQPLGQSMNKIYQHKYIDIETSIKLLELGKDICFSNSNYDFYNNYGWILKDFTIEQHTSSTISKEEQFLNYINGKTPTGYFWNQNSPDGFMQISGNFHIYGSKYQRQINFCNREPFYIQMNSFIKLQIGSKNNEKWIVKFKQDDDYLYYRDEQLPSQYNWPLSRSTWLRIY